jgi:hypothetical protein
VPTIIVRCMRALARRAACVRIAALIMAPRVAARTAMPCALIKAPRELITLAERVFRSVLVVVVVDVREDFIVVRSRRRVERSVVPPFVEVWCADVPQVVVVAPVPEVEAVVPDAVVPDVVVVVPDVDVVAPLSDVVTPCSAPLSVVLLDVVVVVVLPCVTKSPLCPDWRAVVMSRPLPKPTLCAIETQDCPLTRSARS